MPHLLRGADAGAAGTSSVSFVLRIRRGVPLRVRGALRGSTDGVPRRPIKPVGSFSATLSASARLAVDVYFFCPHGQSVLQK